MPLLTSNVMPNKQTIENLYPNIHQWVKYGGNIHFRTAPDSKVELKLGDGGGVPLDGKFICNSLDEAMEKANSVLATWLKLNKDTLDCMLMGDPKITDMETISTPGWPQHNNPHYEGK